MPFSTVQRSLIDVSLQIRNIQYQNSRIYFYTQLPANLDYRKSFQVVFLESIAGVQNIYYNNLTNVYPVEEHPQLLKAYFAFTTHNLYYVIAVPLITVCFFLLALQLKGVYDLLIEIFRIIQMLGILLYASFPIGQYILYFLIGCSYSNLDFIPNIYAMAAKTESVNNLTSYLMATDDMDFIRLNGSVIFFGVVWGVVIAASKYLVKARDELVDLLITFGFDIMEVKVLHSFWSAAIFVAINYKSTNFSISLTFGFALAVFLGMMSRKYLSWKTEKSVSPFLVWRLVGTLLICLISLAPELLINLILSLSFVVMVW